MDTSLTNYTTSVKMQSFTCIFWSFCIYFLFRLGSQMSDMPASFHGKGSVRRLFIVYSTLCTIVSNITPFDRLRMLARDDVKVNDSGWAIRSKAYLDRSLLGSGAIWQVSSHRQPSFTFNLKTANQRMSGWFACFSKYARRMTCEKKIRIVNNLASTNYKATSSCAWDDMIIHPLLFASCEKRHELGAIGITRQCFFLLPSTLSSIDHSVNVRPNRLWGHF